MSQTLSLPVSCLLAFFHVNDLISGTDSPDEVKAFFLTSKQRLAAASFNLEKLQCNNIEILNYIYHLTNDDKTLIDNSKPDDNKVLSIIWDKSADTFTFTVDKLAEKYRNAYTKRQLLHCIVSLLA